MKYLDKILHFLAGFAIATVVVVLFKNFSDPLLFGFLASIVGSLFKEVYDLKVNKSRFDLYDLLAPVVGGIAATSVLYFY